METDGILYLNISGDCKKTYVFGETRKHPPLKDDQLELDFAADGLPDL
jgi:hypothetical protein